MATSPDPARLKALSRVDFDALDLGVVQIPDGGEVDRFAALAASAELYVMTATGWPDAASMPATWTPVLEEAVRLRCEQDAHQSGEELVELGADFELISGMSAGSYSDQRRGLLELASARMINRWPRLNDLLWSMCTATRREQWYEQWARLNGDSTGGGPGLEIIDLPVGPTPGSLADQELRGGRWWP